MRARGLGRALLIAAAPAGPAVLIPAARRPRWGPFAHSKRKRDLWGHFFSSSGGSGAAAQAAALRSDSPRGAAASTRASSSHDLGVVAQGQRPPAGMLAFAEAVGAGQGVGVGRPRGR